MTIVVIKMAVVMMVDMMVIVVLVIGKFAHFTPFLISKWAFEMRKGVNLQWCKMSVSNFPKQRRGYGGT
jgi:hypothetical protein